MTRLTGTLHGALPTFVVISLSLLLRIRNISDKSCRENQNTHFIFHIFSENCTVYEICEKKNVVERDRPQMAYNTANAFCMLDKYGCRRTLRICVTYCFTKETMDKRKRFSVM